jgi:Uma2 family endonuclease
MTELVEQILKKTNAPFLAQTLQNALHEEHQRRLSFYEWIDEEKKAEFVNGKIILNSPVKRRHLIVTDLLGRLLSIYGQIKHKGVVMVEKAMIALTRNDYEPDIVFFEQTKSSAFTDEQMLFPAPDFVVEILSKKTATIDKTIKKQDYALHGVREYWIIDPERKTVAQYLLINPNDTIYFEPYIYNIEDEIESTVITGFKIPIRAIFEAEANLATLKNLLS